MNSFDFCVVDENFLFILEKPAATTSPPLDALMLTVSVVLPSLLGVVILLVLLVRRLTNRKAKGETHSDTFRHIQTHSDTKTDFNISCVSLFVSAVCCSSLLQAEI